MYVPLQVNRFKKFILLIVQYKYLKCCSQRFYCPNLILRTRLCGTMFITQPSCLFYFHLTEPVRRKWFVLAVYQFRKGISAGPALKYFSWFIGAGGIRWLMTKSSDYLITWSSDDCTDCWPDVWEYLQHEVAHPVHDHREIFLEILSSQIATGNEWLDCLQGWLSRISTAWSRSSWCMNIAKYF